MRLPLYYLFFLKFAIYDRAKYIKEAEENDDWVTEAEFMGALDDLES